jgi:Fe-S-cluster containining protein
MITDLVQISRLGEKKRSENERFRKHLKTRDFVDRRFRQIADRIEEETDCSACANCCKVATVPLLDRDVHNLAKHLRVTEHRFLEQYTDRDDEGVLILKRTEQGCTFLSGNLCLIYDHRPSNCVDFPHLVRGQGSIPSRMWQFIDRATYCPIVYNTLEEWKEDSGFQR